MNEKIIPKPTGACINCGTELTGNYCHQCGEKLLNPSKDYSLVKFLEQTVDAFSHLDSKFFRSFWALISKPGFLTAEFIRGKRVPYMKPVQIFIITGILFYFIYPDSSTFFSSALDMSQGGNILNYDATQALQEKMAADGATLEQVVKAVNLEAAQKSKAYLFLIIPLWSMAISLLFWRSVSFLVPHVVFAVHSLSFFILLFLVYLTVFHVIGSSSLSDLRLIPLLVVFFVYFFLGVRKVYQENIFLSILKSLISISVFLLLIVVYRQVITAWALNW